MRGKSTAILVSATIYVVLTGVAAALYPGGTQYDHARVGFAFRDNYLCDLNREVALDGVSNRVGSVLSQIGTLAMIVAILGAFRSVGALFPDRPGLGRSVSVLGTIACTAMLAVPLTPSNRFGNLHFAVVGVAALPSVVALVLASLGLVLEGRARSLVPSWARAFVVVATVITLAHFVQYVSRALFHAVDTPALARFQKVAALFDVAWVILVAALTRRLHETGIRRPAP